MESIYGWALLRNLGPGTIMSNDIVQSIVDAAHTGHIASLGDLRWGVKWVRIDEFGDEVVHLVRAHATPSPLPISPLLPIDAPPPSRTTNPHANLPLQGHSSTLNLPSSSTQIAVHEDTSHTKHKWLHKCRGCGATGHIGECFFFLRAAWQISWRARRCSQCSCMWAPYIR
jgi:hypothetical protein